MRILLVQPDTHDDTYHAMAREISYLASRQSGGVVAPLALLTIAALTPPEHEVHLHDENVRGPVEDLLRRERFDVIGITSLDIQIGRVHQIATWCKENAIPSVIALGGPGTSFMVKQVGRVVDVLFVGEAEETWPAFLEDHRQGRAKPLYQQVSKPDMARSPVPRWELLRDDVQAYACGAVQTTRGCPFDCAFCDVIYIYGRKPRSKPVAQVLEEIRIQEAMGIRFIFISDDDFAGNKKKSKELLRELMPLNNSFDVPVQFLTQADITIAADEEMLGLMADCNFVDIVVGIESPDEASLKELNKNQNLRQDLRESIRKIQSYGIAILGSMIVGADTHDLKAFDAAEQLVKDVHLTDHYLHPLVAPFGTKIWYQMRRQGRVLDVPIDQLDKFITNVVPKQMSRPDWFEHTAAYYERVMHPLHYRDRAIGFVDGVTRQPRVKRPPMRHLLKQSRLLAKMIRYYALQAGPDHRRAFFSIVRHTVRRKPWMLPTVLFVHTRFLLVHKRAMLGADRLRARAAYERAHPEALAVASSSVPIPEGVREHARDIVTVAYDRIHPQVSHRETLYKVLVEALVDYVDRFGESFVGVDDLHRAHVQESCDRVLAHTPLPRLVAEDDRLPERMPGGFTREILDALDHALRSRELVGA
jgi:radical SAM superfamily enzyme YgiQ (UPF0313 family)